MTDALYALLKEPELITGEIDRLRSKQKALRFSLFPAGVSYDSDRVQTSPADRMASVIAEIDYIAGKIRILEKSRDEAEQKVRTLAKTLNNERMEEIVIKRYCDLSSLGVIACDTGETIDCIKQRHSRTIRMLEKTISD